MIRLSPSFKYKLNYFLFRSRFTAKCKRCIGSRYRILTITGLLLVFLNEVVFYHWAYRSWPNIAQIAEQPYVTRLLLVADPQLIGEKDEGILGFITRKDSDRYLAKTFEQAFAHVNPDWTIFLGDIFDEGLSASDDEFKRYFERFDLIFDYGNRERRYIVIPGDNDIGGEYYGDKLAGLRQRFQNYFGRIVALFHERDMQILKLDLDMLESYAETKRYRILEHLQNGPMQGNFRIILNHWPILTRDSGIVRPFIRELGPNLILKGDSHHFTVVSCHQTTMNRKIDGENSLLDSTYTFDLKDKEMVYEISIPTCSYRMGVSRMGYGVLLLDSKNQTAYLSILPTPMRYISLCLYLVYGIFAFLFVTLSLLFSRRTMTRMLMLKRLI